MPLTPEQITEMDRITGLSQQPALSPDVMRQMDIAAGLEQPSFTEGVQSDLSQRVRKFGVDLLDPSKPVTTLPFRYAKELGGAAGDVALRGLKEITPEPIQKAVKSGVEYVSGLPPVQYGAEKAGEFAQEYPNVSDILGGGATMLGAPVATKVGKEGLEVAGKGALETVKYPMEGISNVKSGIMARGGEQLAEEAARFKGEAGGIRNLLTEQGIVISPESTARISGDVSKSLGDIELIPELMPVSSSIVRKISEDAASGNPLTLNKLDQYRRLLRDAKFGTEDAKAASVVRRKLDDAVENLQASDLLSGDASATGLLNIFRKEYTQASKFDDIADIVKKADGDPNRLKSAMTRFINKKENLRGFTDEEKALLYKAAGYNVPERFLKGLGRFGYDPGNVFLPLVGSGVAGFGLGTPAAVALGISGTASRQLYKALGRGKAERLLKRIESGNKVTMKELGDLPPSVVFELKKKGLIREGK